MAYHANALLLPYSLRAMIETHKRKQTCTNAAKPTSKLEKKKKKLTRHVSCCLRVWQASSASSLGHVAQPGGEIRLKELGHMHYQCGEMGSSQDLTIKPCRTFLVVTVAAEVSRHFQIDFADAIPPENVLTQGIHMATVYRNCEGAIFNFVNAFSIF